MAKPPAEILPGTLDMLILRVLARESFTATASLSG